MEGTSPGDCQREDTGRQLRRGGVTLRLRTYPTPYQVGRVGGYVNRFDFASALYLVIDNFSTDDEAELRAKGKCLP